MNQNVEKIRDLGMSKGGFDLCPLSLAEISYIFYYI